MRTVLKWLEWVASRCGFALLLLMSAVIGLQVFMRYVLNNSLTWPEEMTRYCYLWCSMFAIVIAEHQGVHLKIDVVRGLAGKNLAKFLDMFSSIMVIAFYAVFIYLGIRMTMLVNDMEQYAISFDVPMVCVWAAFPLLGGAALVFACVNFGKLFASRAEH